MTVDKDDPFIKKHLDIIWQKTKDAQIQLYIKPMFGSLDIASMEYFIETQTINGGFRNALNKMLDGVRNWSSSSDALSMGQQQMQEKDKEIERLKGLIEKEYKIEATAGYFRGSNQNYTEAEVIKMVESDWLEYKKENDL